MNMSNTLITSARLINLRAAPRLIIAIGLFLLSTNAISEDKIDTKVLVLDFDLNDLTLHPAIEHEKKRVKTLRPLLTESLKDTHNYSIASLSQQLRDQEDKGKGYVFDRPEVAAKMGRAADAAWVVSGRLHKASFLFVYLKAQLIDATDGRVASDFVVEIKGWEPRLTAKGVEALALQIDESLRTLATNH